MLKQITEWWNRPPAKQRIYAALSTSEWRRSLDIMTEAKVSVIGSFYVKALELEREGLIESKWEEGPPDPVRGGHRRRLYRRTMSNQFRAI
jgi:hypothetical protein